MLSIYVFSLVYIMYITLIVYYFLGNLTLIFTLVRSTYIKNDTFSHMEDLNCELVYYLF